MDVHSTSRFTLLAILAIISLTGCREVRHAQATTPAPAPPAPQAASTPEATPARPDPDLHRPPPRRLLDIDWAKISLTNDTESIALWRRIAPTGADWEDKLEEIPAALASPLAIAVLRGGNFTCARPPAGKCAKPIYDVDPPADTAGWGDPCLRRLLALWSFAQLEDDELPAIEDALRAIAAIPPPESQLVASALRAVPLADQDARLAILAIAFRAGQDELVDAAVGTLDEAHLIAAVTQHHIPGALDVLSAEGHRAVYVAAITDESLATRARTTAIRDLVALDDKLPPDVTAALISAVASRDCALAAAAARALEQHGNRRYVPRRPRTANTALLMRAICVLASYEALQHSDEASLLSTYVPARGLERVTITYDPLSEIDSDGDGDPHTTQTAELVTPGEAVLPEIEDLARAMRHCTGVVCVSDDHEFRFVWTRATKHAAATSSPAGKPRPGELLLSRLELTDRPPCPASKAATP
jgi:hypothetical protein